MALLLLAGTAMAFDLVPSKTGKAVTLVRGTSEKNYYSLKGGSMTIPLEGPGELSGWVKMALPPGKDEAKAVLELSGVPGIPKSLSYDFKASTKDAFKDGRDMVVSGGKKIALSIPAGKHHLKLKGNKNMMFLLGYEGPAQPLPKERRDEVRPKKPKKEKKKSGWKWKRSFGLNLNYDDNIVHYSDDLLDEYTDGPYLEWYLDEQEVPDLEADKYRLNRLDDLIVTPTLDVYVERALFSFGKTRLRAKYSYSRYLYNPIKDVKGLTFYLRQYLPGSGQSIELTYKYTPEKYIRQLTDRPPYAPSDDPRPWIGFRFAQNDFTFNYRHRLHKKLFLTVTVEDVHRYYNQAFIEQDLVENEIITRGDYTLSKTLRLSAIYGYARGWTLRRDTVEEHPLSSDDNDNSYTQDRYRVDLRWKPSKKQKKWVFFDEYNLRYQLRIAYFTSPKPLWDDPFHVGRKDVYDTYRLTLGRDLPWMDIGASMTFDYSRRILHSPYTGDISEGMDYDNFQVWLDLTYNW